MAFWIMVCVFLAVALTGYLFVRTLAAGYTTYSERYLKSATARLDQLSIIMAPERLLVLKVVAGFACGLLAFLLAAQVEGYLPLAAFAAAALAGSFLPDLYLHLRLGQRRKLFGAQLIDAMNTLSNGLKSGFSFRQALEMTATQLPDPAGEEFRVAVHEIELGVTVDDAMHHMADRLGNGDLYLMVIAVNLCSQVGGNLPDVLAQLVATIRERNRIEGKVEALTSQGRMQATIVGLVPIGLAVIVRAVNPQMMRPMFTTVIGWTLLTVVAALDVLGYYLIRRIVSIRY